MATIQILLEDDANRRALAMLLEENYTVVTDLELQDADLYFVDEPSLPTYQALLESYKREVAPVFCPVVLIRRDRTPISISLPDPDPSERLLLINEVVSAPVEKQALFRRISSLLVRRQQTRELKRKNDQLEQFARTLRHELRNPLNVLDGYLDIAREERDSEALRRCRTAVDQMNRLLEDTLLVLKGEEAELEPTLVDLSSICSDCWDMIPDSDGSLSVTSSMQILADPDRLAQLFGNLFRNSIEHAPAAVSVTVGDLDGGFYVEDDGSGIPEADRGAVFKKGYSLSGAGTGLGLTVVQAVVDSHGWEISLTDGTAGGARFEITGVENI